MAKDIIKGYEYEKDKYVVMTDEELEKIKTKKIPKQDSKMKLQLISYKMLPKW